MGVDIGSNLLAYDAV